MNIGVAHALRLAPLVLFAAWAAIGVHGRAARAQGGLSFSIQPANSTAGDPTKGAYFTYTLTPGASVNGTAVVTNSGAVRSG